jgi:UDP-N-acetylmuramoylalanine--D-glutamate ligase
VSQQIRESFKLPGRANLSNLAAAIAVAKYFGVDDELIRNSLPEFKPLPHRLELVRGSGTRLRVARYGGRRKVGNRESIINFHPPPAGKKLKTFTRRRRARNSKLIDWYNDSKATTPQSAIAALEAFDRPVIIIAGGYDKELPFEELGQKIAEHAKAAILIGQTAPKIASAIRNAIYRESCIVNRESNHESRSTTIRNTRVEIVESLAEAVQLADRLAETGDVVLLSPACASYDMFDNFEQRGCEFKRLVREIVNRA